LKNIVEEIFKKVAHSTIHYQYFNKIVILFYKH